MLPMVPSWLLRLCLHPAALRVASVGGEVVMSVSHPVVDRETEDDDEYGDHHDPTMD